MSDLLIKDIGMPNPGSPIIIHASGEGKVFVGVMGGVSFTENEAYELPAHGRLVDADELLYRLVGVNDGWINATNDIGWRVEEVVKKMPTIIPASVEGT